MTDSTDLPDTTPVSPYQRIGGAPTIRLTVDRLYELILADGGLSPFFIDTDMPQQKAHMAALLTRVLGGPDGYIGRDIGDAHRGMGITTSQYQQVGAYLVQTLEELGAPGDVISDAGAVLTQVAPTIIEKPEPAPATGQDG